MGLYVETHLVCRLHPSCVSVCRDPPGVQTPSFMCVCMYPQLRNRFTMYRDPIPDFTVDSFSTLWVNVWQMARYLKIELFNCTQRHGVV